MPDTPLPEQICQGYLLHPACREIVSKIKPRKDPVLYCTFTDVLDLVEEVCKARSDINLDASDRKRLAQALSFVAAWREHKQIYNFDPELAKILIDQDLDGELPIETLYNLPYKCIYIQTDLLMEAKGFFVYFDTDEYIQGDLDLKLCFVDTADEHAIIPIHLIKGKTLEECVQKTNTEMAGGDGFEVSEDVINYMIPELGGAIQLILYLCAENKDVVERKRLEFNKKKSQPKKKKVKKKQIQKEAKIQEWAVGSVITKQFKRSTYTPSDSQNGNANGTKKSPHMRKAHWHHYWVGARESEERRLVLKWVQPSFIHAEGIKGKPIIVNEVKK